MGDGTMIASTRRGRLGRSGSHFEIGMRGKARI